MSTCLPPNDAPVVVVYHIDNAHRAARPVYCLFARSSSKIRKKTQELKNATKALEEELSNGRATFDPMLSDYGELMDIFKENLIILDQNTKTNETNEDQVRRAVHDILSTEIREQVLQNREFSYYKDNFTTAVGLMQRFNELLLGSRKNIQTRLRNIYKLREIENNAENKGEVHYIFLS